jgi:hypothetical protein
MRSQEITFLKIDITLLIIKNIRVDINVEFSNLRASVKDYNVLIL